ncbi:MAG: DJ-1/PfpI family protein [Anaerolineales bacterium]|nr:DJ-1/PfpI family protein [Anaerolineales bacterium]
MLEKPNPTRKVAVLLFDDVEVLDFAGPFEVFSVTAEINPGELFQVYTVAEAEAPILTRNGLSVNPDYRLTNCPPPNILIVPGGQGTRQAMKNPVILDWVKRTAKDAELVLSVCTGSLILGAAGLLDGLRVTTHHQVFDLLREVSPESQVMEDERFIDNGRVITSGGISAGIDMSLYVIGRLLGEAHRQKTAAYMEYRLVGES